MSRLLFGFLALALGLFPQAGDAQQSRGMGVVPVVTQQGKKIALYKGSYALLIGMADYTAGWPDLESVPNELKELEGTLLSHGFHVTRVMNPDSRKLGESFEQFIDDYGYDQHNRLLIFYSGHGYSRNPGGRQRGYLVPVDAPNPSKDEKGFLRKALDMGQIQTWARRIEAKHALFLFDSCFSGTIFKTRALPVPRHITDKTTKPVRQFITAGSAGEEVPAKSVFLPSFIRAINGDGDINKDGYVTATELGQFLHETVLSYDSGQTPQYGKIKDPSLDEGDFVFLNPAAIEMGISKVASKASVGSPTPTVPAQSLDVEEEFWKAIRESNSSTDFEAYIKVYPGGRFVTLARLKIQNLAKKPDDAPDIQSGNPSNFKKLAFFPALINGPRASEYSYLTGEFQGNILQALQLNFGRARVTFTYDTNGLENLNPKPKTLETIRGLGEESWEGMFSKSPNESYIKQIGKKIGVDAVALYEISAENGGQGSYSLYLIDIETGTVYEKSGYWRRGDLRSAIFQGYSKIFNDYKSFGQ